MYATCQPVPPPAKTVSFKTIGCRLNQAETAAMTGSFTAAGYSPVAFGTPCDVAIIHGCTITRAAESESLQSARRAKRANQDAIVILAGCPAETMDDALRPDAADLVIGQKGKMHLPALLNRLHPNRFPPPPADADSPPPHFETKRAFIKIQDGCDFHCAYCIVPSTRGAPQSRPLDAILNDVHRAAINGFREIILTGANLGCYQHGTHTLASLLAAVNAIPEVGRFRLGSVEMTTAEDTVLDFMSRSTKLCRFLHLPLQSGDDRILAAMGRRYTSATYRRVVNDAAARLPGLGLGTDIIVGFPGEDKEAFENTIRLVTELPLSNIHVFPYSRRPHTRADTLPNQIPEIVKKERGRLLMEIAGNKRRHFAQSHIGRNARILVEKKDTAGLVWGWTGEYLDAKVVAPKAKIGDLVDFSIDRVNGSTLIGTSLALTPHDSP